MYFAKHKKTQTAYGIKRRRFFILQNENEMKVYIFKNTLTGNIELTVLKNDNKAAKMLFKLGKNWTCRTIN